MTQIIIKLEEEITSYKIKQNSGHSDIERDCELEIQHWQHVAEFGKILEVVGNEDTSIKIYTDGSKQEQRVGSRAVISKESEMIAKLQLKTDNKCSKNQAEQLAILKALEKLEGMNKQSINPLSTTMITDSRITLDSLQNYNNICFLVEDIRKNGCYPGEKRISKKSSRELRHTYEYTATR